MTALEGTSGISAPNPCTVQVSQSVVSACSFMALPCKQGSLVDMNPLGLISLLFPQRRCLAAMCVSTLAQGEGRKGAKGTPRNRRGSPLGSFGLGTVDWRLDGV